MSFRLVSSVWDCLSAQSAEREACKNVTGLMVPAADGHETQLAQKLNQLPGLDALTTLLAPPK